MATENPNTKMVDTSAVPRTATAYADQLVQLAVGPHISRLVFGLETDVNGGVTPSLTIVIPTPRLLDLAQSLQKMVGDSDLRKTMVHDYRALADAIDAQLGATD